MRRNRRLHLQGAEVYIGVATLLRFGATEDVASSTTARFCPAWFSWKNRTNTGPRLCSKHQAPGNWWFC